ncbi:OprO/OprP family phosphate-selective porin [Sandaracinus amylolyticus]|uniref:OprO/OprP family phosphate-selective porin n=1 Tax=Sandaracinus amylolyticus TaxID=927083 RepID=UPI001F2F1B37|nr:OprO/OprP family phosphate-selective porin [Sandaracinus amylolyticus]UJR82473.1 Hypothetical protein I5071_45380 [Sandaracinus amylolyticus]
MGRRSRAGESGLAATIAMLALFVPRAYAQSAPAAETDRSAPAPNAPSSPPATTQEDVVTTDVPGIHLSADDGFVLTAPDRIASLRLGLVLGARAQVAGAEDVDVGATADIRFARLRFSGHVADPALRFFVQPDFGGSGPRLLDAAFEVHAHPLFIVEAGQFLLPWGTAWLPNPAESMFPETGPARDYFALGRDTGVMVYGATEDSVFSYWVALGVGRPVTLTEDDEIRDALVVARVVWQPLGAVPEHESPYADGEVPPALALGVGGFFGRLVRSVARFDNSTATFGSTLAGQFEEGSFSVDAIFVAGPVSAQVELDAGHRTPVDPAGAGYWALALIGQVGVFVVGHVLQVALRGSYLDPSEQSADDLFAAGEVELALYPWGVHAALLARYGVGHHGTNTTFLDAPAGWGHIGTLQLQAYF